MVFSSALSLYLLVGVLSVELPTTKESMFSKLENSNNLMASFTEAAQVPPPDAHTENNGQQICSGNSCSAFPAMAVDPVPASTDQAKNIETAKNDLMSIFKEHPNASPLAVAEQLKQKWQKSGVYDAFQNLAVSTGSSFRSEDCNHTSYSINIDSALAGVAIGLGGTGDGRVGPSFTVVAFVNHGFNSQGTRMCIGTRAGISLLRQPTEKLDASVVVGVYEYEFVPGAAWFAGPTLHTISALLSTKASKPSEFIGLVVPVKLMGCDGSAAADGPCTFVSPMPNMDQNNLGHWLAQSVSLDVIMGYTWCF